MATKPICKVEGCDKISRCLGFCNAHYLKFWRFGDPLGGRKTNSGEALRFLEEAKSFAKDECLLWPYSGKRGYGMVGIPGHKKAFVHRLVCEHVNGPPPTKKHQAAHSCGNGAQGCISPKHLRWATQSENNLDILRHGRAGHKLKTDDIPKIKDLLLNHSQTDVAKMFDVNKTTISRIHLGRTWSRDAKN